MDTLYTQSLGYMEETLRHLERYVVPPERIEYGDSFVFRYTDKSIHQAIIQKLARVISGLHAARILLQNGFVQELGALQRMINEFQEDITFLSYAVVFNDVTERHQKFLDAFYEEEFDKPGNPVASTQRRSMIPRQKIRAYIARIETPSLDPTRGVALYRTVSNAYSGYVHGASPHIMEMYGGSPPGFYVDGMLGTPRIDEHTDDLRNYFFRGIAAFSFAAKAFGNDILFDEIMAYSDHFIAELERIRGFQE